MQKPGALSPLDKRWPWMLLALWLYAGVWLTLQNFGAISALALPDPDDNLRLLQVRDWLDGQSWFDLRQHRLAPAGGADIHWTRLVDLPLAGLIAAFRPWFGGAIAETVAVAMAPLLTLLVAMALLSAIARRTIAAEAWFWAAALLLMTAQARSLMSPLRIDHHGWQLALLAAALLGLIASDRHKGGIIAGAALAVSLGIGVEMTPLLIVATAAAVLCWIVDDREAARLRPMVITAGAGGVIALMLLIPPADRLAWRCDSLSISFLLPLLGGSAILVIGSLAARTLGQRMAAAAAAILVAALPLLGPAGQCLSDPYHEVDRAARALWLGSVVEAAPLYRQPIGSIAVSLFLPMLGLLGGVLMLARSRGYPEALRQWILLTSFCAVSLLLLLQQTRALASAEIIAIPGVAALCWLGRSWLIARSEHVAIRAIGTACMFLALSGLIPRLAVAASNRPDPAIAQSRQMPCTSPSAIGALDALPAGAALTFIDTAPAVLAHSNHSAIAGPYHRNGRPIADVMTAWAADEREARSILKRYGVRWIFLCAPASEADLYRTRAPNGLFATLDDKVHPKWLQRQPLSNTPWRAWKIIA